jgi:amidohydrolase
MDISKILSELKPDLSEYESLYKELHKNPGLSLQEEFAAETVEKHLRGLKGFDVRTKIGGTGLIGILKNGDGKTVMLRADMDALPVKELTGLPYASEVKTVDKQDGIEKPVMHACGHDMHVACLLAAANTLHNSKGQWKGTLIVLFQPNEERGAGSKAMIDDGLYDDKKHACPAPDVVLGQHVSPYPTGTVGTRSGTFMSAADSYKITVYGRGGHASQPHKTVDPVVMAAHIVVRLQSIVSREVDPGASVVITVASIEAGMAENAIPAEASMKLNIRTAVPETRKQVLEAIKRIVKAECDASNASKDPKWERISEFPFTINDDGVTEILAKTFRKQFGDKYLEEIQAAASSEDFSTLATEAPNKSGGKGVPYSYWVFGGTDQKTWDKAKKEGKLETLPINHSAYFAPVIEPTLSTGTEAFVAAALSFLK